MSKNFYNLPPSWNPGYADPGSVLDEGLERRAFVTQQAPRGTFDNPSVGTAGYAVPRSIVAQGYGRGAAVTSWLPRGYVGPGVPHWLDQQFSRITGEAPASNGGVKITMETLGDSAPYGSAQSSVFTQYGRRAAAALISSVQRLPANKRAAAIRQAMDKVDPSLHARAGRYAERARAQGATAPAALAHGIAAAMTEGMLAELKRTGSSRTAPQRRSLLGLGCYGCAAALGATKDATANKTSVVSSFLSSILASGPQPGDCSADGKLIFDGTTRAWRHLRAGEVCGRITSSTSSGAASGGVTSTNTDGTPVSTEYVELAPGITFPAAMRAGAQRNYVPSALPSETRAKIRSWWTTSAASGILFRLTSTQYTPFKAVWDAIGIKVGDKVNFRAITGGQRLLKFKHPKTGEDWAATVAITPDRTHVLVKVQPVPDKSWLEKLISVPVKLITAAAEVVQTALETVAELGCQLVSSPGAAGAAAAASGGAAAVGVAIASGFCPGSPTGPAVPPPPPTTDYTIPVVLGAGALALLVIAKKKKAI